VPAASTTCSAFKSEHGRKVNSSSLTIDPDGSQPAELYPDSADNASGLHLLRGGTNCFDHVTLGRRAGCRSGISLARLC
jgi:hypothetical protein